MHRGGGGRNVREESMTAYQFELGASLHAGRRISNSRSRKFLWRGSTSEALDDAGISDDRALGFGQCRLCLSNCLRRLRPLGEVDSAMRWSALTVVYEEYQSVKLGGVTINTQPLRV